MNKEYKELLIPGLLSTDVITTLIETHKLDLSGETILDICTGLAWLNEHKIKNDADKKQCLQEAAAIIYYQLTDDKSIIDSMQKADAEAFSIARYQLGDDRAIINSFNGINHTSLDVKRAHLDFTSALQLIENGMITKYDNFQDDNLIKKAADQKIRLIPLEEIKAKLEERRAKYKDGKLPVTKEILDTLQSKYGLEFKDNSLDGMLEKLAPYDDQSFKNEAERHQVVQETVKMLNDQSKDLKNSDNIHPKDLQAGVLKNGKFIPITKSKFKQFLTELKEIVQKVFRKITGKDIQKNQDTAKEQIDKLVLVSGFREANTKYTTPPPPTRSSTSNKHHGPGY